MSELNLLREPANQSSQNLQLLHELERYWESSPGNVNTKLENFPKYVGREAITKFLARNEVFLKQLNVHGSIVELGVARGASLMTWFQLSAIYEPANYIREIIGFDTFSGIPSIDKKDTQPEGKSEYLKIGGFAVEENMEHDIETSTKIHSLTRYLNHIKKVQLIKGDIALTLPDYISKNPHLIVSLLNIDVDIYHPATVGLRLIIPRMPKGGVIVFDEINSRLFPGETQAVQDVLGIKTLRLCRFPYCPTLSYSIIE